MLLGGVLAFVMMANPGGMDGGMIIILPAIILVLVGVVIVVARAKPRGL